MSLAVCGLALFCLVSVSQTAPLTCEDLLRPVDQVDLRRLVDVDWVLVAGSLVEAVHVQRFKTRDSAKIRFSNTSDPSVILIERFFGFGDKCDFFPSNITLEGSSFSSDNVTVTFTQTSCPDCLLLRFTVSWKVRNLYLFSKSRRELERREMEEFRAQGECINGYPPVVMDHTKKLCPSQPSTHQADQTEEETEGQNA